MLNSNKNPTFNAFVNEVFMQVFDGLVRGGTKEMKVQMQMALSTTAWIAQNGGFTKE